MDGGLGSGGDPASVGLPSVPGFEVLRVIGRGGFATVYEARQLSVDRLVALKVISGSALDDEARHRFRAECKAVGELSWHPHVVALYDAGITPDGSPFLAMDLLPGGSLGAAIARREPMDPGHVLQVGIETADALDAAHQAGIVHRDIKPDNLLLGRRGEIQVGDFGVASLGEATRSAMGSFSGTYGYLAPEILHGERPTERSDLFSLGATLYALLAGQPAFHTNEEANPAAVMFRIVSEEPAPLPDVVPPALDHVIRGAMAKDPAQRPPSAAAFREALRAIASSPGAHAPAAAIGIEPATPGPVAEPADDDLAHVDPATVQRARPSAPGRIASEPTAASQPSTAPSDEDEPAPRDDPGACSPTVVRALGEPAMAEASPPASRRRWPWVAAAGFLVLALVALVAVAGRGDLPASGGDEGQQVDARTEETTTTEPADPGSPPVLAEIDLGSAGVWAASDPARGDHPLMYSIARRDGQGQVLEVIDPLGGDPPKTAELPLDDASASQLVATAENVWVTGTIGSKPTLLKLDPASGEVVDQASLSFADDDVVKVQVANGRVWVAGDHLTTSGAPSTASAIGSPAIIGMFPDSMEGEQEVPIRGNGIMDLEANGRDLLVASGTESDGAWNDRVLTTISPTVEAPEMTSLEGIDELEAGDYLALAPGPEATWVGPIGADGASGRMSKLGLDDGAVQRSVEVGEPIYSLAADDAGGAWVATSDLSWHLDDPAAARVRVIHLDANGTKDRELAVDGGLPSLQFVDDELWLVIRTFQDRDATLGDADARLVILDAS